MEQRAHNISTELSHASSQLFKVFQPSEGPGAGGCELQQGVEVD